MSRLRLLPHATLVTALVVALLGALPAGPAAAADRPVEAYASYHPQTRCSPRAKPGTVYLAHFLVRTYGGRLGSTSRRCGSGGTSEHKEGRALDWMLDATRAGDRATAAEMLERLFRTDSRGDTDAWARRMGIMYLIWNDHLYPASDHFRPEPYLSSSCPSRKRCSKTLRHRDHLHVSLTRRGGSGRTSWYDGRIEAG